MAKRFVNFYSEDKANEIAGLLGVKYMREVVGSGSQERTVYVFFENDKMHRLLQDKNKYSKRDYYYSNTLRY